MTTPDTEFHPHIPASEMPEVHEGGNVPSSSGSSSKDSKVNVIQLLPENTGYSALFLV